MGVKSLPEYHVWRSMIARCYNSRRRDYCRYGAVGITVCSRWRKSFHNFYADMGPRPDSRYSIERVDGRKGYKASNCRWATAKEQARNRTTNTLVKWNGHSRTVAEWAELTGIKVTTILYRIQAGWPVSRILNQRVRGSGKHTSYSLTHNGETRSVPEWAAILGTKPETIYARLRAGWSVEKIVSQKPRKWIRKPAQLEFEKLDAACETTYADKRGKYQGQMGVTPARVL